VIDWRWVIVAGAVLVSLVNWQTHPTDASSVDEYCVGSNEAEFLDLINAYRAQHGVGALAVSGTLGSAAEHKSLDMAATGTLTHVLSDGTTWLDNIINHGYPYGYRTENIAWGYASAQSVFDAWKASSAHNSNMLNGGFGAIGIQRVYDANAPYRYYWATTFGSILDTPASVCGPSATPTPTQGASQPPVAPTDLHAIARPKFVQLSWRDNADTETGYLVFRSADGGATWATITDALPVDTTGYRDRDTAVERGQSYAYVVVAVNPSGASEPSNTAVVRAR
jgi:uncharacterized protein YkwD